MAGYYDYVLGLIPIALVGIPGFLSLSGFPTTMAIPVGACVALALMLHAMFVRTPVHEPQETAPQSSHPPRFGNAE